MDSTFLSLMAEAAGTVSVDFFKWACAGLAAAIIALAKAYHSLATKKSEELAELNKSKDDEIKLVNADHAKEVKEVHADYQKKIAQIVDRKDSVIDMLRNSKEQSDTEAFEKITNLLIQQTNMAVSNQQYADKMMSIMQEAVDKLDDIEPLLELLAGLGSTNNDLSPKIDEIIEALKELKNDRR